MKNGVNCKGLEKSVSYALLLLTVSLLLNLKVLGKMLSQWR